MQRDNRRSLAKSPGGTITFADLLKGGELTKPKLTGITKLQRFVSRSMSAVKIKGHCAQVPGRNGRCGRGVRIDI